MDCYNSYNVMEKQLFENSQKLINHEIQPLIRLFFWSFDGIVILVILFEYSKIIINENTEKEKENLFHAF